MEGIFIGGLFAVCGVIYLIIMWNERQEEKRRREEEEEMQELARQQAASPAMQQGKNTPTRDLFLEVLTKMGCQYKLSEDDDIRIWFAYQGEHFYADTTNDHVFVQLCDPYWEKVELYDIDEVSRLRKSINTANMNTSVTTVYTIDEAGSNVDVHSKTAIPFISSMPDLDAYLHTVLNEFFRAHQMIGIEMAKLREKEKSV